MRKKYITKFCAMLMATSIAVSIVKLPTSASTVPSQSFADVYVLESSPEENWMNLTPGTVIKKDPRIHLNVYSDTGNQVGEGDDFRAWVFAEVVVPRTTFTLSNGSTYISELLKPEKISAGWKLRDSYVTSNSSIYVYSYAKPMYGTSKTNAKNNVTEPIFNLMAVPTMVNGRQVKSVDTSHGAVVVKGYVLLDHPAKYSTSDRAYNAIRSSLYNQLNKMFDGECEEERLQSQIQENEKLISDLQHQIVKVAPVGTAKQRHVAINKTYSSDDGEGLTGTMPVWNRGYFDDTSFLGKETNTYTDIDGVAQSIPVDRYVRTLPPETGLVRNADTSITIKRGFHTDQFIMGLWGGHTPTGHVLAGQTFSDVDGPKIGTMPTMKPSDITITGGHVNIPALMYTGINGTSHTITPAELRGIITDQYGSSKPDATPDQVLTGKTFYGAAGTKQTGTMPNRGDVKLENKATTQSYTGQGGYYSSITADSTAAYNAGREKGVQDATITLDMTAGAQQSWSNTMYYKNNTTYELSLYFSFNYIGAANNQGKVYNWKTETNGTYIAQNNASGSKRNDSNYAALPITGTATIKLKPGQYVRWTHSENGPVQDANGSMVAFHAK